MLLFVSGIQTEPLPYSQWEKSKINGIDTCIQNAQIEFVKENPGTKQGPDTDLYNLAEDRWDGVHFSKKGLDKFARELFFRINE